MPVKGLKTSLAYSTSTTLPGSSYTDVAKIIDVTPPKPSVAKLDSTTMDSPASAVNGIVFKEQVASAVGEVADVEIGLQFTKAQATALYSLLGKTGAFKCTFADGSKWEFIGFIQAYGDESVDVNKLVTTKVTIAVSGEAIFTAAA